MSLTSIVFPETSELLYIFLGNQKSDTLLKINFDFYGQNLAGQLDVCCTIQ